MLAKFKEIVSMISKGLSNPELVLDGWIMDAKLQNNNLDDEELTEILRRRAICSTCPFMSFNAKTSKEYKEVVGISYGTTLETEHCSFCSCPIKQKTASLNSECGITSWNLKNLDKKLPLRWDVYKKENKQDG